MTKFSIIASVALLGAMTSACMSEKPSAGFAAALPPTPVALPVDRANGGIFQASTGYAPLYTGNRARAVGDPLTILLVESTSTTKAAGSNTARDGGFSLTPPASGPFSILSPDALSASGNSSFKGQGKANQSNSLSGQLTVTIAEVRPNGTALVRGEKRMTLSQGEEWIQFSGIVRLSDIDEDSRILSSRVADARIIYAGNGSIQRAGHEGWLSRFFNMITPF